MTEEIRELAARSWPLEDDEAMRRRLDNYLSIIRSDSKRNRWGQVLLTEGTEEAIRDMYIHLEFRAGIAERAMDAAAQEVHRLNKELQGLVEQVALHQDLTKRLDKLGEYVENSERPRDHPTAAVGTNAPSGFTNISKSDDPQSILDLQSRIHEVNAQRDEFKRCLEEERKEANRWRDEYEAARSRALKSDREAQNVRLQADQGSTLDQEKFDKLNEKLAVLQLEADQARNAAISQENEWQRVKHELEAQLSAQEAETSTVLRRHEELEREAQTAHAKYTKSQDNARSLFDQIQDLKGNLRVMCRIRPQLDASDAELENLVTSEGTNSCHLQVINMAKRNARNATEVDEFEMERIFDKDETNKQIFDEVAQLVGSAINGRNVCIFAYGQTGSGKSHTMTYPWNEKALPDGEVDLGIIPRAVDMISNSMKERQDMWKFSVSGKYIEIYAEKVYDLLRDSAKNAPDVPVRYGKETKNGKPIEFYESDSISLDLTKNGNFEGEIKWMLERANGNRRVRATAANTSSSRSHSVLSLRIIGDRIDGKPGRTDGTLNLIDLAGSEKPSTTDRESQKEGIQINQSLSTLRKVLAEMASPRATRFSFKESTLTKLLQSSLGDGCITLMFVMVSPLRKDRDETRNTLEFAMQAQKVKLRQPVEATAAPRRKVM
ncbi:hypothetical protein JX266_000238 [Neoarthrinium moseri]|nr:hypothetical protein JX266_000238 [Neoarthrinium moseri]